MSTSGFSIGKVLKRLLIIFLIVVLGIVAYFLLTGRRAVQLAFPDLEDITYVNAKIKNDSAFTKLRVVLQNKNPYKLSIDTLSFDMRLNDTSIAKEIVPLNIRQGWLKKDTASVPLNLSMKKIKGLLSHLKDQDSTFVEARGYVVYQTFFGRFKLNFDKRTKVIVPIPPKIKLLSIDRQKFNFKTKILKTTARLQIKNEGKLLALQLYGTKYKLKISDELYSEGEFNQVVNIEPESDIRLNIPMDLKVHHPIKTKLMIITDNDRLPYTLFITFMAKERISQKKYNSPIELQVSGSMELEK